MWAGDIEIEHTFRNTFYQDGTLIYFILTCLAGILVDGSFEDGFEYYIEHVFRRLDSIEVEISIMRALS